MDRLVAFIVAVAPSQARCENLLGSGTSGIGIGTTVAPRSSAYLDLFCKSRR